MSGLVLGEPAIFRVEAYIAFCLFAVLNVMTGAQLQEEFILDLLQFVKVSGILCASLATLVKSGELDTLRAISLALQLAAPMRRGDSGVIFGLGASITTSPKMHCKINLFALWFFVNLKRHSSGNETLVSWRPLACDIPGPSFSIKMDVASCQSIFQCNGHSKH